MAATLERPHAVDLTPHLDSLIMLLSRLTLLLVFVSWLTTAEVDAAQQSPAPPAVASVPVLAGEIVPTPRVVLPRVGDYRRAALHIDPIEAAVARGDWPTPEAGDLVLAANGAEVAWREASDSPAADLAGGYAYAEFESDAAGVMLLEARGAAAVWLNGEWLPGDPYGVGWFRPPVEVVTGTNRMLVHRARPDARPRLVRPTTNFAWLTNAATLPDLVAQGEASPSEPIALSIPFVNATTEPLVGARLRIAWSDGEPTEIPLRSIESLLITPITIKVAPPAAAREAGEALMLRVEVLAETKESSGEKPSKQQVVDPIAVVELKLSVVERRATRTATFISKIDGSVQPYGVMPPVEASRQAAGVVVALHDTGETPAECLARYTPREGTYLLAPGCRGRWAFDGEDWSREDALEALADFEQRQEKREEPIDAERVSLLGQGMGGHAALHLATLRPDKFAALGIVDGWLSFYTQGGARVLPPDATPIAKLLERQSSANDPLRVIENLRGLGVSVLVTEEGRVAPTEGRYLRERLGEFHDDFAYRETSDAASVEKLREEQIDWLTTRYRPRYASADDIDFATPDLGAASALGWVTLLSTDRQGEVARVRVNRDRLRREVIGTTQNVRRLRLSLEDFGSDADVDVRLDGGKAVSFRPGRNGDQLALAKDDEGVWRRVPEATGPMSRFGKVLKGPERDGRFKSVFCCRPVLVNGTRGDEAERSWAAAKARYDAHLFLYRGAGRLEVQADKAFRESLRGGEGFDPNRSVVLYGNARTNSAWSIVEQEAILRRGRTIRLDSERSWLGARPEAGDSLALIGLRPRAGSRQASLGVVGGTGVVGMRMTTRLRYFWSGVNYPDILLFGPTAIDTPADPASAADVRAAGSFDVDWGIEDAGVLWRDLAI